MKILVVEDERITRRTLQRRLANWGHQVFAAENGAVAWDIIQREPITIVITDWEMPELDGLELLRRIRLCPRDHYTYVILLTSKSAKRDLVEGMEAGADDFLSKPFNGNELRARLHAGIRIIELEQDLAQRNREISLANAGMKSDLEAAARLQQSLLPKNLPKVSDYDFAWSFIPCDELAGDILNVFQLDAHHIGFYIADVSGHGVPAALLAVTINRVLSPERGHSSLLFQVLPGEKDQLALLPAKLATELNRQFQMDKLDRRYFSINYGVIDIRTRILKYIPAGHPPIVRVSRHGIVKQLPGRNFAIGWFSEGDYRDYSCPLEIGDRLVIYSDGITETVDTDSEQFGEERLMSFLAESSECSLEETVRKLSKTVRRWCVPLPPKDDISVLAIKVG